MKEVLQKEIDALNFQLEILKDSKQSEGLVNLTLANIEERLRSVEAQMNLLILQENGAD